MTSPRIAGKYGRRPPKRTPSIKLARLLTGVVPAHPAAADYLAQLSGGWQMLGNDSIGDCNSVTWANMRRLVTGILAPPGHYPSLAQVFAFYKTQNPGFDPNGSASTNGPGSSHDGGMDVQTGLEYLVASGGPDGVKALGFASVDHANVAEVQAAIALFGSVWTGTQVLNVNQTQFGNNQPWDYVANSPVDGGHAILTGGYGAPGAGALGGDQRFITWGQETSFTDLYWANEVEEAWVVIWPEMMKDSAFLAGVNMVQFAAEYTAITGKPFPAAIPPPPPSADAALWASAGPWCAQGRTRSDLVALKAALETWATSKGL